jgi:CRP/FNR family transcriptional regulator
MLVHAIHDIELPSFALAPIAPRSLEADAPTRTLACHEVLFEAGDVKEHLYRIETGALCIYSVRPDFTYEVIEFALAGDLVGMGFLERHAVSARATVDTTVKCLPLDAADNIGIHGERAKKRFDDAMRREFASRRDSLVAAGRANAVERLASFLMAASHRNGQEGRDPTLIDGALDSAVVADYLGCSVDLLALTLVRLEMQGLVETAPNHALRLTDLKALEVVAAG